MEGVRWLIVTPDQVKAINRKSPVYAQVAGTLLESGELVILDGLLYDCKKGGMRESAAQIMNALPTKERGVIASGFQKPTER